MRVLLLGIHLAAELGAAVPPKLTQLPRFSDRTIEK
jgi:hypothetical protein